VELHFQARKKDDPLSDIYYNINNNKKQKGDHLSMEDFSTNLLDLQNICIDKIVDFDCHDRQLSTIVKPYDTGINKDTTIKRLIVKSKPFKVIYCHSTLKQHICPHCGLVSTKVHDYRYQLIKDIPSFGKFIFLYFKKPRYECECCNRSFIPKFDFIPRYYHTTTRLNFELISSFHDIRTLASIGKQYNVSISKVQHSLKKLSISTSNLLPKHLGIDEFKGNLFVNQKYQVLLTNLDTGEVFDVLPTRDTNAIANYLEQFPNKDDVELLIMDMTNGYNRLKYLFKNCEVIVDHFHICKYIYKSLNDVRLRVQRKISIDINRKRFKLSRYVLFKPFNELKQNQIQKLDRYLSYDADLYTTYFLKEQFDSFNKAKDFETAKTELGKWKLCAEDTNIPELHEPISAITNWFEEIANWKKYGFTNALTEGKNNLIKVVKEWDIVTRTSKILENE